MEPATDLAIALAVVSAQEDFEVRDTLVAIGEVGLAGELRPAIGTERRLSEARRLGFTHAIVPPAREQIRTPAGMRVQEAPNLGEAVRLARAPSGPVRHLTRVD